MSLQNVQNRGAERGSETLGTLLVVASNCMDVSPPPSTALPFGRAPAPENAFTPSAHRHRHGTDTEEAEEYSQKQTKT